MPEEKNYTARLEEVERKLYALKIELASDREFNDGRIGDSCQMAWMRTRDTLKLAQRIDTQILRDELGAALRQPEGEANVATNKA